MRKTRSLSRVETRAHTLSQTNNRCDDLKRIKLMTVKLCVLYYENFVNKSRQRDAKRERGTRQKLIYSLILIKSGLQQSPQSFYGTRRFSIAKG